MNDEEQNQRAATLAVLLDLSDHTARQWSGRTAPGSPAELVMLALQARSLAATLEAVADHAQAAALEALDAAEE